MKSHPRSVAVLLIIAATFLVYWPALRNGFVWDDTALVLRDPLIRSWRLIPEGFGHFLFLDATASNFYRPLQRLSFTADYALYGFDAPWGWHLTSILVHAGAALALFFLALQLTAGRAALSAGAALLWAVHPLHTSAVTYVAGRADPLAALFGFTALACAMRSLESPHTGRYRLAAAAGFLAALLAKESGIFALVIWLAVLAFRRPPLRLFGKWLLILASVLGVYLLLRLGAERTPPPPPPATPLAVRPLLAARAVAEYAGLLVAPRSLRMERDITTRPQRTPAATERNARLREAQTLLGVVLLLGLAVWWRRASSSVALCLTAAALAYLPISNLFSLNATVAEHWLYVPSAFFFLALGLSVRWRPAAVTVVSLAAIAFGVRSSVRQGDWRDQQTFLERTIADGGATARMHINLGNLDSSEGRHPAALGHFREAIALAPDQPLAWLGYANAAMRAGDLRTAREALDKVGTASYLTAELLQARATLETLESGFDRSESLAAAVAAAPRHWPARRRLLQHLASSGRADDAARQLREFLADEPFRGEAWRLLGEFLEILRQPAGAAVAYREAARRDVRDAFSRARLQALVPRA